MGVRVHLAQFCCCFGGVGSEDVHWVTGLLIMLLQDRQGRPGTVSGSLSYLMSVEEGPGVDGVFEVHVAKMFTTASRCPLLGWLRIGL